MSKFKLTAVGVGAGFELWWALVLQQQCGGATTTEANGVLCGDTSLDADLVWSAAAVTEIDGDCPC